MQRLGLVLTLVYIKPFFVQFAFSQALLMLKPIYFSFWLPYENMEQGLSDFSNDVFLVFAHSAMAAWITQNVPDDNTRYQLGWLYSALITILMLYNAWFVISTILKERSQKRFNNRLRKNSIEYKKAILKRQQAKAKI